MQSDERVAAALSALRPQIALFRYLASGTLERARNTLASEYGPSQARVALGDFAAGRIDPNRFAMISSGSGPLDAVGREALERTAEVLEFLVHTGDEQFFIDVQPGTSAGKSIRARMVALGSAFGAAALVELVRRRTYDPAQHSLPLEGHPFEKWTSGERRLSPPLVIHLDGRDLDVFELAPIMDGCVRLILLVDEPCAPASLARLISPGVFVAQVGDLKVLDKLSEFDGPAVIAVMKGAEARFVYDPRAGSATWQCIQVMHMSDVYPRRSLGSRSAWQQRDDLSHLKALVEPPSLPSKPVGALAPAIDGGTDPVERLTAWLLDQSSSADVA
jgi:hypothetical protein